MDEADDVGERGEVTQPEAVLAGDREPLPDRREHLGLLDRVHAQVGLQVKIEVEQVTRVPGQARHDIEDRGGGLDPHPAARFRGRGLAPASRP